jgi:hypothetical protein
VYVFLHIFIYIRVRMIEVEGVVEGERGRAIAAITAKKEVNILCNCLTSRFY